MTNSSQTACGATVRLGVNFQSTVSIHWIIMEHIYCAGMQPGEVMANTFAFLFQKGIPLCTKGEESLTTSVPSCAQISFHGCPCSLYKPIAGLGITFT